MSLDPKSSKSSAPNEVMTPTPPVSSTHPIDAQSAGLDGNHRSQAPSGSTSKSFADTEAPFDESSDELPPAYEAVSASPSQILPSQASPPEGSSSQGSSSQVGSSSNTAQGTSKSGGLKHNPDLQDVNAPSSQQDNNAQGQNVYESPEMTRISVSTDPNTCFQRAPPEPCDTITYERLPNPFVIQGRASKYKLPDLFSATGIPAFSKHDIRASDWEYFIQDLMASSRYSSGQRVVAGALPVVRRLGPPGALISHATESGMRKGRMSNLLAMLEAWNEHFFKLRRLEVILCKGDKCKSGRQTDFLAPDRRNAPPSNPPDRRGRRVEVDYRLVVVSI